MVVEKKSYFKVFFLSFSVNLSYSDITSVAQQAKKIVKNPLQSTYFVQSTFFLPHVFLNFVLV